MGVIYAGPVADGLAFAIAATLLVVEMKNLGKQYKESYAMSSEVSVREQENNIIITVGREYGSGGRYVAKLVAERLGLKFYDKDLLKIISDKSGLSAEYIEQNEQNMQGNLLSNFNTNYYNNLSNDDNLFIAESNAIKGIAERGGCVIVGRCSNYILKNNPNIINIFLYSDDESKVRRAVKYYGLDEKNALKEINRINKNREKHYNYYTHEKWRNIDNYDLSINVDKLGVEKTAGYIANFVNKYTKIDM